MRYTFSNNAHFVVGAKKKKTHTYNNLATCAGIKLWIFLCKKMVHDIFKCMKSASHSARAYRGRGTSIISAWAYQPEESKDERE